MTKLLFGLGTGRCGTTSLHQLLNLQHDCRSAHEPLQVMKWGSSRQLVLDAVLGMSRAHESTVAMVDFGLLPYAQEIHDVYPQSRFIVLQRSKEETVRSFKAWLTQHGQPSHWVEREVSSGFDDSFPKLGLAEISDAVEVYWEMYYGVVDKLRSKMANRMTVFPTDSLNDPHAVRDLLIWAGFRDPQIVAEIHLNQSHR